MFEGSPPHPSVPAAQALRNAVRSPGATARRALVLLEARRRSRPEPAVAPELPRFIMGTGDLHALYERRSVRRFARTDATLDAALGAGIVGIDTAAAYGMGTSERAVGHFIASRKLRDRVVIIGKGGHPDASGSRLDPASLNEDLDSSLRRLRVDHIDLYMLHRDDPSLPVGPIMTTLHRFVQSGKVRSIGASNWTHRRIAEANEFAAMHGYTQFSASSPHLSLAGWTSPPWQGCVSIAGVDDGEARAWYARSKMPVLAWSPLAGGFLAQPAGAAAPNDPTYANASNRLRRDRLRAIARERDVDVAQLAVAYLLNLPVDVRPILYSSAPHRLATLVGAAGIHLTDDEMSFLDGESRATVDPSMTCQR